MSFFFDSSSSSWYSGFVFLRFFCPAILDPSLFGMAVEHPDQNTGRTFTLVAKTLQNLANLVEFGAKEPFMADMNVFITKNLDSMKVCIDKMCALPKADLPPSTILDVDLRRELASFHALTGKLTELQEANATGSDEGINRLFGKIAQVTEASTLPRSPQVILRQGTSDSVVAPSSAGSDGNSGSPDTPTPKPPAPSKPVPLARSRSGSTYAQDSPSIPTRPPPSVPPVSVTAAAVAAVAAAAATSSPSPPPAKPPLVLPASEPPVPSPKPRIGLTRSKSIEKSSGDLPVPSKLPPPTPPKPGASSDMMKELANKIPKDGE